jgi:hypothetical protein
MKSARDFGIILGVTDQPLGLRIAGLIFALICLGHLVRIFAQVEVRIGTYTVPMWPSILAAAVTGVLATWLFLLAKRKT